MEESLTYLIQAKFEAQRVIERANRAIKGVGEQATRVSRGGLSVLRGAFNSVGSAAKGAFSAATSLTGLLTGAAVTGAIFGLVSVASEAEETAGKFSIVFESVSEAAENTANALAENFGLARTESKRLLAGTGDLLTGFGFTDEAALDLSKQVQELSVDLASFQNLEGGAAQASDILTKALLGERDALTTLGVKISDADLQARLAAEGNDDLTGTALLAAKAQTTFALVLEQTGKAQGDFARTSTSVANQQRILGARFSDVVGELGGRLLPVANQFIGVLIRIVENIIPVVNAVEELVNGFIFFFQTGIAGNDFFANFSQQTGISIDTINQFTDVLQVLGDFFSDTFNRAREAVDEFVNSPIFRTFVNLLEDIAQNVVGNLRIAFEKLVEVFTKRILPVLQPFIERLLPVLGAIIGAIIIGIGLFVEVLSALLGPAIEVVGKIIEDTITTLDGFLQFILSIPGFVTDIVETIIGAFQGLAEGVGNIFNGIRDGIQNVIDGIANIVTGFFSAVANVGGSILDAIKQVINAVIDSINDALEFEFFVLGVQVVIDLPDLPRLATGTLDAAGGLTLVGERGPELVNMPQGSRVYNAADTSRMMNGSQDNSKKVAVENVNIYNQSDYNRFMRDVMHHL